MFKKNTVILYCAKSDNEIAEAIGKKLQSLGYVIHYLNPIVQGFPLSMKQISSWEYTVIHDQYGYYFENEIIPKYKKICQNGLVIPIISRNMFDGDWSAYASGMAIRWFESNANLDIVPVSVDYPTLSNKSVFWDGSETCLDRIIATVQAKSRA